MPGACGGHDCGMFRGPWNGSGWVGWLVLRGPTPPACTTLHKPPLLSFDQKFNHLFMSFFFILFAVCSNLAPQTLPKSIPNRTKRLRKSNSTSILSSIVFLLIIQWIHINLRSPNPSTIITNLFKHNPNNTTTEWCRCSKKNKNTRVVLRFLICRSCHVGWKNQ